MRVLPRAAFTPGQSASRAAVSQGSPAQQTGPSLTQQLRNPSQPGSGSAQPPRPSACLSGCPFRPHHTARSRPQPRERTWQPLGSDPGPRPSRASLGPARAAPPARWPALAAPARLAPSATRPLLSKGNALTFLQLTDPPELLPTAAPVSAPGTMPRSAWCSVKSDVQRA